MAHRICCNAVVGRPPGNFSLGATRSRVNTPVSFPGKILLPLGQRVGSFSEDCLGQGPHPCPRRNYRRTGQEKRCCRVGVLDKMLLPLGRRAGSFTESRFDRGETPSAPSLLQRAGMAGHPGDSPAAQHALGRTPGYPARGKLQALCQIIFPSRTIPAVKSSDEFAKEKTLPVKKREGSS